MWGINVEHYLPHVVEGPVVSKKDNLVTGAGTSKIGEHKKS